ncbi:MAG: N-acetyl-gamma-glutamyl-phosphate reductase [Parcubacteria group bacterium GW2011_GWA2_44_12]|nr:MAG: N-acetyl-gamma-glutamyl-phosphate reductase [Parcubacteria group bacterium GW2011_GWA2_44_12]
MEKFVSIIGAGGYTGKELLSLVARHPFLMLDIAQSFTHAGEKVSDVYSEIPINAVFSDMSTEKIIARKPSAIFFATKAGVAMRYFPTMEQYGIKGVDLSPDYRFSDVSTYESAYNITHADPIRRVPYGLPEFFKESIKGAKFVANPGCYATACLLAAFPIKDYARHVVFDCKSGWSGSGQKKTMYNDQSVVKNNILAYKLTQHRHEPEIQQFLPCPVYFTPHVIPTFRGILATCHLFLKNSGGQDDIFELYEKFYRGQPFITVTKDIPHLHQAQSTNRCVIGGFSLYNNRLVVVSVLDNLLKGASGQAIQNMNIMFGFPSETGLR